MSRPLGLLVARSSAFAFDSAHDFAVVLGGRAPGYSYSRIDNPSAAASTTHRQLDDNALAAAGIAPGQVRLSVGVEDPEDLLADLRQALDASESLDGPTIGWFDHPL